MITINQQPDTYSPVYNPLIFVATSDNTAEDNFNYIVDVYWSGVLQTRHRLPARPDNGLLLFDASEIVQAQVTHNFSYNDGFFQNSSSYLKFQVKFGEEYDTAGVSAVHADLATSNNIYAINAAISPDDFTFWDSTNFLLTGSSSRFLTNAPIIQKTRSGESAWLYSIASSPANYDRLQVKKYNASGLIATATIPNTYNGASDVNTHLKVGVGYINIEVSLGGGYLVGATYYTVQAINSTGTAKSELRRFDIVTNCERYTPVRLHFLNKLGGFDSFTFTKVSKDSSNIERSGYKKKSGSFSGSSYVYTLSDQEDITSNVTLKDSLLINSDFLSEEESLWLKELVSSPVVFQEISSGFKPVTITDAKYEPKKKVNEKLFNLQLTIAYKDSYRQRY
jgi:hypothetical protein